MSALSTLRGVVAALDASEIPFMIVGSGAAWIYGHNRPTYDFDIVIDPTHDSLDEFVHTFESTDMYVGPSPHEALDRRDQFNLVDPSSGWKVDLIVLKDRPFNRSEFERRREDELLGINVWVATPEDVILAKLEWGATGGSARQFEDVVRILEVKAGELDDGYIDRWADELGVREQLDRARAAMSV